MDRAAAGRRVVVFIRSIILYYEWSVHYVYVLILIFNDFGWTHCAVYGDFGAQFIRKLEQRVLIIIHLIERGFGEILIRKGPAEGVSRLIGTELLTGPLPRFHVARIGFFCIQVWPASSINRREKIAIVIHATKTVRKTQ